MKATKAALVLALILFVVVIFLFLTPGKIIGWVFAIIAGWQIANWAVDLTKWIMSE